MLVEASMCNDSVYYSMSCSLIQLPFHLTWLGPFISYALIYLFACSSVFGPISKNIKEALANSAHADQSLAAICLCDRRTSRCV